MDWHEYNGLMMNAKLIELAATLGQRLKTFNWKMATAESCTAGGLSYYLTAISGSSEWFECGYIIYSNHAKMQLLGVSPQTLAQEGAVSEQTALEMARNCLHLAKVDLSVAITGIAGPTGGSDDKPVGTVWIAVADNQGATAKHFVFAGDRAAVREQAIEQALMLLQNSSLQA